MAYKLSVKVTKVRQRVVQFRESTPRQYCDFCGREVEMVTNAEAVRVLRVDQRTLACLIGDGSIHTVQSVSGAIWVCKESLFLS